MRRILVGVSRRLGSLLIAFIVAVAPAILTACEVVCAARDAQRAAQFDAAGHSCHGTPPSRNAGLDSGVEACGHGEAFPAASYPPPPSMPALAVATPLLFVWLEANAHRVAVPVAPRPDRPRAPLPLRI